MSERNPEFPTPWHIERIPMWIQVVDADGEVVCAKIYNDGNERVCRRIVATVNAAEGKG